MIERHHDYVLELGTIAAGQVITAIPMPMDSDAPFILRAVGGYSIEEPGASEIPMTLPNMLLARYADADGNWQQNARTPKVFTQVQGTEFVPVCKHVTYPARSAVQMEFQNLTAGSLLGVTIIFRGVKLFPGDRVTAPVYAPTYPPCYTSESFTYLANFNIAAGAQLLNQPIYINDDADFAWRNNDITSDPSIVNSSSQGLELRLRDPLGKGYASYGNGQAAWIRSDWLFGSQLPARAGFFYPEIYIGKGQSMSFDARNLTGAPGPAAVQLQFDGAKVFRR